MVVRPSKTQLLPNPKSFPCLFPAVSSVTVDTITRQTRRFARHLADSSCADALARCRTSPVLPRRLQRPLAPPFWPQASIVASRRVLSIPVPVPWCYVGGLGREVYPTATQTAFVRCIQRIVFFFCFFFEFLHVWCVLSCLMNNSINNIFGLRFSANWLSAVSESNVDKM